MRRSASPTDSNLAESVVSASSSAESDAGATGTRISDGGILDVIARISNEPNSRRDENSEKSSVPISSPEEVAAALKTHDLIELPPLDSELPSGWISSEDDYV